MRRLRRPPSRTPAGATAGASRRLSARALDVARLQSNLRPNRRNFRLDGVRGRTKERPMHAQVRLWFLSLMMVWALSHAAVFGQQGDPVKTVDQPDSPANPVKKALDQTMTLDYQATNLLDAAQHLKEKTRVNFIVDVVALQNMGLLIIDDMGGMGPVHLKGDRNTKIRSALQRMLNAYNLSYVILDDSVLITTEEIGLNRQMRQRVSVNYTNTPLQAALKDLARSTA